MSGTRRLQQLVGLLWPEAVTVFALSLIISLPVWPGVFTIDSQAMLRAVRRNEISNWYAPVLQQLWRGLDAIALPVGTVLLLATVGLVAAVLACFRLGLSRGPACIATTALLLWPPAYGMAGWVGRDVWFVTLSIASIALIGWAIRTTRWRWWLLAMASLAAWFAADARQNGFPVLIVVGAMVGWAWAAHVRAQRAWPRVVAIAAAMLLLGMGSHAVVERIVTTRTYAPDEILYWQDLVSMSLRRDHLLFPPELRRADLGEIRQAWIDGQVGSLTFHEPTLVDYRPYTAGHVGHVRAAWIDAIRAHPIDYLAVRADLASRVLGLRSGNLSAWFDRSDDLGARSRGLHQRFDALADARAEYLDAFDRGRGQPGILHAAWAYLLLGVVGASLLIGAGGNARVFGTAVLALQVLLQGAVAVAVPVAEYRYEYFQVLIGPIALVLGVCAMRARRRTGCAWPPPGGDHRDDEGAAALSPGGGPTES